jgi:tetratricopeptide (TPR) repeat protein
MATSFSRVSFVRGLCFTAAVAVVAPFAQAGDADKPRELSQKTVEVFAKIRPLNESKNFAGMLALLDGVIPTLPPNSYDVAIVQEMRGKIMFALEKYNEAIPPLTQALKLADDHDYIEMSKRVELLQMLSALHYQEGTNTKLPAADQRRHADLALGYLDRFLKNTKKITPESSMLYANMLYNKAIANPQNPDKELLKQMRAEVERGLYLSIAPKEGFYALLLAGLQQEQDYARGSELLEFLVTNFPEKKDYWPTLLSFYLNMMNVNLESDPRTARIYNIRAINTIERGQKLGNLNTPKDNYNLVTLYINAGQYGRATEMLHAGLKAGTIESDVKTWNILGSYYLQAEQPEKAIAAIQEAIKLFPQSGQLELLLGTIYRDNGKAREGFRHFQEAVRKGNLDKPEAPLMLIAYTGYELEEYDEALKAIEAVESTPEGQKDTQLPHLKRAIISSKEQKESRTRKKAD